MTKQEFMLEYVFYMSFMSGVFMCYMMYVVKPKTQVISTYIAQFIFFSLGAIVWRVIYTCADKLSDHIVKFLLH